MGVGIMKRECKNKEGSCPFRDGDMCTNMTAYRKCNDGEVEYPEERVIA